MKDFRADSHISPASSSSSISPSPSSSAVDSDTPTPKSGNDIITRVRRIVDATGRKRRIYSTIHKDPKQSSRRFRANDRERRRMNSLNGALQALRGCVPLYHGKKRMTKLQILQFACTYINDLSEILCDPMSECIDDDARGLSPMDSFMSYVSQHDQQMKDSLMTSHLMTSQLPSNSHNNDMGVVNLNMMQRLDYLTIHSQMQMGAGTPMQAQVCMGQPMMGEAVGMLNSFC